MMRTTLFAGLLIAGLAASGCSPYLTPYGPRAGRYPFAPAMPMAPMDPASDARGRWDKVMLLPADAGIGVVTFDKGVLTGRFSGADGYTLRLIVRGIEEVVPRVDILRVDLVDQPGSTAAAVAKRTAGGAALGIGAAALISAVLGGPAWPPSGLSLRAGAAAGGVAGAQAELINRQPRLVYLAESQRPPGPSR